MLLMFFRLGYVRSGHYCDAINAYVVNVVNVVDVVNVANVFRLG